ncbi:STAS domain-containing protein [Roseicyclus sp. F158]|uniref:STAS domain-containing protein n=1 Tax=Tropicimonas omnivorans TaxID=3075590 RepID=A0ABU3DJV3_9RHOB|nr:STAS domain-containing protein [Roseicyclus sp. F158]MDT0683863.1 STAS domain-containing protein [Roseicyclus sp. F158]
MAPATTKERRQDDGAPRIVLPARLDLPAAAPLAAELQSHADGPIVIDATNVAHLGTPGLQVLLSAVRTWWETGRDFSIEGLDEDAITGQLAIFGLTASDFQPPAAEG